MKILLTAAALLPIASYAASDPCTTAPTGGDAGDFATRNGQIIGPEGRPFIARGVAVSADELPNPQTLLTTFPGLNFVRVAVFDYNPPEHFASFVKAMTSKGIVVELENHQNNAGGAGGAQGVIFMGTDLRQEQSWYRAVAAYFKANPYVWFGTNNEPSTVNPVTGNKKDMAALSNWQKQTYDTIRSAGNGSIVMLEINGWNDPQSWAQGYASPLYASMSNVVADMHFYGWLTNKTGTTTSIGQAIKAGVATIQQRLRTKSGPMPVIIGEYGNSTDGENVDPNGTAVVDAVHSSGLGTVAWWMYPGNADNLVTHDGSLTAYGKQVAGHIKSAASSLAGCRRSTDHPGK